MNGIVVSVARGFVRAPDGTVTEFDEPNDVRGTSPVGINDAGAVAGSYYDANYVIYGFLRVPNGTITTFADPSAATGVGAGTSVGGINTLGEIVGCYTDSSYDTYAFLRGTSGAFTTLAPPTSTGDYPQCTEFFVYQGPGIAINELGAITANYFETIAGNPYGGNLNGFLRGPDGSYETFAAAPSTPCCVWTFPVSLNVAGTIAGYYNDGYSVNHGFVRGNKGAITILDAPNAGTGSYQGTVAYGINVLGAVTGWYIDANSVRHGFLWTP